MTEKNHFLNSKNQKIIGILEEPDHDKKKIVILVHGYSSSKNGTTSSSLSRELEKRNVNSLRIDLDGCGESEGKFENQTISSAVDDIQSAINFVKRKGYTIIDLFGVSAGGLAVMATALNETSRNDINKIGLKCPVYDYPSQRERECGKEFIELWKKQGSIIYTNFKGNKLKVNYEFFEDAKKYAMFGKINGIKVPVLIIHGTADQKVPYELSKRAVKEFPNAKLVVFKDTDHFFSKQEDLVRSNKLFADWFEK